MANPSSSVAHGTATNFRAYITYSKGTVTNTSVPYTFTLIDRIENNQSQVNTVSKNSKSYQFTALGSTQASGSEPSANTSVSSSGTKDYTITTKTINFPRASSTSNTSQTVSLKITSSVSGNSTTATVTLSIEHRTYHTVSYNANGGSGTIASQNKFYGDNITLSDGSGFTWANRTLIGWNTAADGSGTSYSLGQTYSVNSTTNITLYAVWQLNAVESDVKVSGTWKDAIVYTKVNGAWVLPYAGYVKVSGAWKQITKE